MYLLEGKEMSKIAFVGGKPADGTGAALLRILLSRRRQEDRLCWSSLISEGYEVRDIQGHHMPGSSIPTCTSPQP